MAGFAHTWSARVFLAFLLAPVPSAAILAITLVGDGADFYAFLGWTGITLVVAWIWTMALGVPVYVILKRTQWLRLWSVLLAAFAITSVPWAALMYTGDSGGYSKWGGKVLIQQGNYTFDGHMSVLWAALAMGALGLLSGFIFWAIAIRHSEKVHEKV